MSTKIAPSADNSQRKGGGNTSVKGEAHGQKKAERVEAGSRFSLRSGGETQPGRQNEAGNVPVTGEMHGQKKAQKVEAGSRF